MGEYFLFEKEFLMRIRVLLVLLGILSFVILSPAPSSYAAQRCFTETNQCMDGRIAEFWEQNGGLVVFGFPIGPVENIKIEGNVYAVQRFERNRLELHPENARPYDVLLGRLGVMQLKQNNRDWFSFPKSTDTGGCKTFNETGHAVCGAVLKAWRSNGLQLDGKKGVTEAESLALFGLPLSGLMTETLSDGKQYQVQWFERARFELHPENAAPYDVLLGLLGNEVQPAPTVVMPTATPVPRDTLYDVLTIGPMTSSDPYQSRTLQMKLNSFRFEGASRLDYETPKKGYTFLIVDMSVTNLGPDEKYIADISFNVLDSNGRVIDYNYMGRVRDCNLNATILAGGNTSGCMAFEVPASGRLELIFAPFKYDQYGPGRYLKWVVRP